LKLTLETLIGGRIFFPEPLASRCYDLPLEVRSRELSYGNTRATP
jgi:hypothetical protein